MLNGTKLTGTLVILVNDSIEGDSVVGPFNTNEEVDDFIDEFGGGWNGWTILTLLKPEY